MYIELNAVRCAAGCVARALRKKLVRSAYTYLKRGDLQLCLWDILDDGDEGQMKQERSRTLCSWRIHRCETDDL